MDESFSRVVLLAAPPLPDTRPTYGRPCGCDTAPGPPPAPDGIGSVCAQPISLLLSYVLTLQAKSGRKMLMRRVEGADPERIDKRITTVLEAQAEKWGAPLLNHLIYARRLTIFHGARAMWGRWV